LNFALRSANRTLLVSQRLWQGSGRKFTLLWGRRTWVLELDDERPGLRLQDEPVGSYLALEGIAAVGRSDRSALSGKALIAVEAFRSRVEATFAPAGWAGLIVRAAWSPSAGDNGVDLDIQVSASSVDELRAVEVFVGTRWFAPLNTANTANESEASWVYCRDPDAAGLSYDGREPAGELRSLTTLPVPLPGESVFEPVIAAACRPEIEGCYIEMVRAHDAARRIIRGPRTIASPLRSGAATRYGLFGHDLEKGVIVRGRLRGLWGPADNPEREARRTFHAFLEEPLSLGT
jgi:hypothetical protein